LTQELTELRDSIAAEKEGAELDSWFTKLGDDYADVYGKAPLAEMDRNSKEVQARFELVQQAHWLRLGAAQMGTPVTMQEALRRAMSGAAGNKVAATAATKATKKITDQIRNTQGQFQPRPSGRNQDFSGLPPMEAAMARLEQRIREENLETAHTVV